METTSIRDIKFRVFSDIWYWILWMKYFSILDTKPYVNNTTMMYTWMNDKNWKEIYEWDICKLFRDSWDIWVWIVYWNNDYLRYEILVDESEIFRLSEFIKREIIWNIYENQDLILYKR